MSDGNGYIATEPSYIATEPWTEVRLVSFMVNFDAKKDQTIKINGKCLRISSELRNCYDEVFRKLLGDNLANGIIEKIVTFWHFSNLVAKSNKDPVLTKLYEKVEAVLFSPISQNGTMVQFEVLNHQDLRALSIRLHLKMFVRAKWEPVDQKFLETLSTHDPDEVTTGLIT